MSQQYLKRIILKFKGIFSFTLKITFIFMNSLSAEKNMFIYFNSTCMQCAKYFQAIHISLNKFVMLHEKKNYLCFQGHKLLFFSDFGDNKIYICMCLVSWSFKCQIEGWKQASVIVEQYYRHVTVLKSTGFFVCLLPYEIKVDDIVFTSNLFFVA